MILFTKFDRKTQKDTQICVYISRKRCACPPSSACAGRELPPALPAPTLGPAEPPRTALPLPPPPPSIIDAAAQRRKIDPLQTMQSHASLRKIVAEVLAFKVRRSAPDLRELLHCASHLRELLHCTSEAHVASAADTVPSCPGQCKAHSFPL